MPNYSRQTLVQFYVFIVTHDLLIGFLKTPGFGGELPEGEIVKQQSRHIASIIVFPTFAICLSQK